MVDIMCPGINDFGAKKPRAATVTSEDQTRDLNADKGEEEQNLEQHTRHPQQQHIHYYHHQQQQQTGHLHNQQQQQNQFQRQQQQQQHASHQQHYQQLQLHQQGVHCQQQQQPLQQDSHLELISEWLQEKLDKGDQPMRRAKSLPRSLEQQKRHKHSHHHRHHYQAQQQQQQHNRHHHHHHHDHLHDLHQQQRQRRELDTASHNGSVSSLLDLAMRTAELTRKNRWLAEQLRQLARDTDEFVRSVMANPENRHLAEAAAASGANDNYGQYEAAANAVEAAADAMGGGVQPPPLSETGGDFNFKKPE